MTIKCGLCPDCFLATPNVELAKNIEEDEFKRRVFTCPGCGEVYQVDRAQAMGWTTVYFNDGNMEE